MPDVEKKMTTSYWHTTNHLTCLVPTNTAPQSSMSLTHWLGRAGQPWLSLCREEPGAFRERRVHQAASWNFRAVVGFLSASPDLFTVQSRSDGTVMGRTMNGVLGCPHGAGMQLDPGAAAEKTHSPVYSVRPQQISNTAKRVSQHATSTLLLFLIATYTTTIHFLPQLRRWLSRRPPI